MLTESQKIKSITILNDYINSGEFVYRKEGVIKVGAFQELRRDVIKDLKIHIKDFLNDKTDIDSFKKTIDSINKKNNHWGFTAIKGQMFFNQLLNVDNNKEKVTKELIKAISLPENITSAKEKIDHFCDYIAKLMIDGADKRKFPNISSVPYFLSYFWQIQDHTKFPVFYHSTDITLRDLNFLENNFENWGQRYVSFFNLLGELRELFKKQTLRDFSFWDVEHVFWFEYMKSINVEQHTSMEKKKKNNPDLPSSKLIVTDDYIPPVVKDIPLLAFGDEVLSKKYESEGKKIEDIFEDKLYKLFVMLGYETDRLGKGKGRVPDGIAYARQEQYAVIYDAKSRRDPYNIGTDSRAIIEYINYYSRILHKQGIKNIYFAVISSDFKGNQEDAIKEIKIETGVQEFVFLKADVLLFILELKLKNFTIGLGKDGLQQIFLHNSLITREEVQDFLLGM